MAFHHTTGFNAILAAIKPAEFEKCLLSWITALHEITEGQLVAIDAAEPSDMMAGSSTYRCTKSHER